MAVASSRGRTEPLRQWRDRETSPERTKVWKEPKPRKVPVVYYLSRNGQLEHPHFMEVTLSSADGLYLRDVIDRLDFLRGKGMANLYSWSSKRSYKNGFVWHDLSEDDLIHPVHGHEYVLKGSELLQSVSSASSPDGNAAFYASDKQLQIPKSVHDDFESLQIRRKRAPWSSFDLNEYKVYKTDLTAEAGVKAADASTQTDDGRSRRRAAAVSRGDGDRAMIPRAEEADLPTTELEREEISPPPSSSSPETLETLIKADGRAAAAAAGGSEDQDRSVGSYASGRMRASAVLMHLLSCGSINVKDHHGFSVSPSPAQHLAQCKERAAPRGGSDLTSAKETDGLMDGNGFAAIRLEDKEYFSGSLIETKKKAGDGRAEFPGLKRSSSFNADRSSKLELAEKGIEGVRAKCIPRKHKSMERREANAPISRSTLGSKRINNEPQEE
ncbi:protein UPSTREAM OF FLC-like [Canna indica]|uniref:Protein UPSTREAM OF FLC-like n=1 Tax=Canna indica TaxID=4628 RepID=A0AAQ3L058_9LILI|nr:protein UPSTREAM OF FLC-like [Canna indica]